MSEHIFRLPQAWLRLGAAAGATTLGYCSSFWFFLTRSGRSFEEMTPTAPWGSPLSPEAAMAIIVAVGVALIAFLGRILVYEVRIADDGSAEFRTPLRTAVVSADDSLRCTRMLVLYVQPMRGHALVLLPALVRQERLVELLEARSAAAQGARPRGSEPTFVQPVPEDRLDSSLWRIVRTDSLAYSMAWFGGIALLVMPVAMIFIHHSAGGEALRPDGSVRPLGEVLLMAVVFTLTPSATLAPLVAFRVARWRAILRGAVPVQGWIEEISRARGDRLVRFTYPWADRHREVRLLVRPTPEVEALRAATPEVILVRQDRPRQALPQALFM